MGETESTGSSRDSIELATEFKALAPNLRAYLIGLTGNAADADEVCQDTFIKATEHVAGIRNLKSWVYRVATNLAVDGKRRDGYGPKFVREGRESEAVADWALTPEQHAAAEQTRQLLHQVLGELPEEERALLRARFDDGLSGVEIAKRMGISSREAVYQRLTALYPWVRLRLRALGVVDSNLPFI